MSIVMFTHNPRTGFLAMFHISLITLLLLGALLVHSDSVAGQIARGVEAIHTSVLPESQARRELHNSPKGGTTESPASNRMQDQLRSGSRDSKDVSSSSWGIPNILKEYGPLFPAIATLIAALVALYLGDWKARLRRPKLSLSFSQRKQFPYFHKLAFGSYDRPIDYYVETVPIKKPGFNARIKVYNGGETTAKGVRARVERIVFQNKQVSETTEMFYHPTAIKWSGERDWRAVDIPPKSHFFLDVFWSTSERVSDIVAYNHTLYKDIDVELLREIVRDDIRPLDEAYWNVWVDLSYDRGLPVRYGVQGNIAIHFIVNAENSDPLPFEALIDWSPDTYDCPSIRVRQDGKFINNG